MDFSSKKKVFFVIAHLDSSETSIKFRKYFNIAEVLKTLNVPGRDAVKVQRQVLKELTYLINFNPGFLLNEIIENSYDSREVPESYKILSNPRKDLLVPFSCFFSELGKAKKVFQTGNYTDFHKNSYVNYPVVFPELNITIVLKLFPCIFNYNRQYNRYWMKAGIYITVGNRSGIFHQAKWSFCDIQDYVY